MTSQRANRILVLGGSGFVGSSLCARLVDRNGGGGGIITVPTRRQQHAKHLLPLPTLQVRQADLRDDRQLAALVTGHDAVINLIAILHGDEPQFQSVHVELPRRLAAACVAHGVPRLIHVSALGVAADAPSAYLRSKAQGEAVLKAAGLELTVLRPSVMFGENDRFINLFASMQQFAPFVPLAGHAARMQPVWVEDVVSALLACLDRPPTRGQVIECAGPAVFTLGELVKMAGRWAGHRRAVLPLPDGVGSAQAWVMEHLPGPPLLSRDNLLSLKVPNIASGTLPGLESLGIVASDIRSVMPPLLAGRSGPARLDLLRAPMRGYGRRG